MQTKNIFNHLKKYFPFEISVTTFHSALDLIEEEKKNFELLDALIIFSKSAEKYADTITQKIKRLNCKTYTLELQEGFSSFSAISNYAEKCRVVIGIINGECFPYLHFVCSTLNLNYFCFLTSFTPQYFLPCEYFSIKNNSTKKVYILSENSTAETNKIFLFSFYNLLGVLEYDLLQTITPKIFSCSVNKIAFLLAENFLLLRGDIKGENILYLSLCFCALSFITSHNFFSALISPLSSCDDVTFDYFYKTFSLLSLLFSKNFSSLNLLTDNKILDQKGIKVYTEKYQSFLQENFFSKKVYAQNFSNNLEKFSLLLNELLLKDLLQTTEKK